MKIKHHPLQFFVIIFLILSFCNSCQTKNGKKATSNETDSFYTIAFNEIVENKREVKLSEIASDVELVQLENIPEAMLANVEEIAFTKEFVFIMFWQHPVLQFSLDGKFIRDIGKKGKGPGEYNICLNMTVDEENESIYIHTTELNTIVFNFDGEYLKTYNYQALENFMSFWIWGRDSCLINYFEPFLGSEPFVFVEHNAKGDTIQTIPNYIFFNKDEQADPFQIAPYEERNFYYYFENKCHMKGLYNDTVYTYDENNKLIPKYFIDLGKYKLPVEFVYERKWKRPLPTNLYWTGVHETSNYVFLPYGYHYNLNKPELEKKEKGLVLYNKKTKEGAAVNETQQGGIIDDMMGGPDFRPNVTNGNTALMLVSALDMKLYLDSEQFKKQKVKLPEKKEKLTQLKKTLNENDNHFLVLAKLK